MAALEASVAAAKEARGRHPTAHEYDELEDVEDVEDETRPDQEAGEEGDGQEVGRRRSRAKKAAARRKSA